MFPAWHSEECHANNVNTASERAATVFVMPCPCRLRALPAQGRGGDTPNIIMSRLLSDHVAAHVAAEHLGDLHRAVLAEIVLEERDKHTRRRDDRVVQRVCEILRSVRSLYADAETARLRIAEI